MKYIAISFIILVIILFLTRKAVKGNKKYKVFQANWRIILTEKVEFYNQLNDEEKKEFEDRVLHFLNTTRITGIKTEIDDTDLIFVASGAIIPVFAFKGWEYKNLKDVLIYPKAFSTCFEMDSEESMATGMVGTGMMNGKMILMQNALHQGFINSKDKKNVAIHEFVHLIDKSDGVIDGVPANLLDKQFVIPWLDLVRKEMEVIWDSKSDINSYGGVSATEFFPVITEYFFERPKVLKSKHPELYKYLEDIFNTDLSAKYKKLGVKREIGRNDPCPCGSGKKFKHCCLKQ